MILAMVERAKYECGSAIACHKARERRSGRGVEIFFVD